MPRRSTPALDTRIAADYAAGGTSWQLAERYGLSQTSIRNIVRRTGGKMRSVSEAATKIKFSPDQLADLAARYQAGEPSPKLAAAYGCCHQTIVKALRSVGVQVSNFYFSAEELPAVVAAYRGGESANSIAMRMGTTAAVVCKSLRNAGVNVVKRVGRKARHLTPQQEACAADRYRQGATTTALAVEYGMSPHGIGGVLRRQGVRIRTLAEAGRRYTIDTTVFDAAESDPSAQYWLGLLVADGCVVRERADGKELLRGVVLGLSGDDGEHVQRFRDFLRTDTPCLVLPPGGTRKTPHTRLAVSSPVLAAKLVDYGITPRKSLTVAADQRLVGSAAFWTGVVDGDGTVWWATDRGGVRRPHLGLAGGSQTLIEQFSEFVAARIGRDPVRVKKSIVGNNKPYYTAVFSGRWGALAARLLYTGSWPMLPRKKQIADELMEYKPCIAAHSPRELTTANPPQTTPPPAT